MLSGPARVIQALNHKTAGSNPPPAPAGEEIDHPQFCLSQDLIGFLKDWIGILKDLIGFLKDLIGPMDLWAHGSMGPSPCTPKAAGTRVPGGPWVHGPYQILKETYQILKDTYQILKDTYQILSERIKS